MMHEIAGIITAIVGFLALIGAGAKFIWGRVDARISEVEHRATLMEADLKECHKKHEVSLVRREKLMTVIEKLWQELQRISPKSPVFSQVKKLLDDLKPTGDE